MVRNQRDDGKSEYIVTNITTDRALNCNEEAGALLVADVLGTLIADLIEAGVIKGTVA
jgi:hypothetical protein